MALLIQLLLHHSKSSCYGTSSSIISYWSAYSTVGCYSFSDDVFDLINCASNFGGAFYISAGSTSTLAILSSVFRNCSNTYSQGRGGGFFATVIDVCINRTCFYSCKCLYYGQAFYIDPQTDSGHFFNSTLVSISHCSPDSYGQYSSAHISIYNQILTNVNSSYNKVTSYGAGFYSIYASAFAFTYSSIFQTNATSGDTVMLRLSSGIATFSFANIIGNTATGAYIIEQGGGSLVLSSCIFASNTASSFTNNAASSVAASSCWVDNSSVASSYTSGFTVGSTGNLPNAFYFPNKCANLSTSSFTHWYSTLPAFSVVLVEIASVQVIVD